MAHGYHLQLVQCTYCTLRKLQPMITSEAGKALIQVGEVRWHCCLPRESLSTNGETAMLSREVCF